MTNDFCSWIFLLEIMAVVEYSSLYFSDQMYSKDAAIKHIILHITMLLFCLISVGLFYASTHSLDFMQYKIYNQEIFLIFVSMYVIYTVFKLGAFPFHSWSVNFCSNANEGTIINGLLINRLVVAYILINLGQKFIMRLQPDSQLLIKNIVYIFAVSGTFYGYFMTIVQKKYKNIFIYLLVAHMSTIIYIMSFNQELSNSKELIFYLVAVVCAATGGLIVRNKLLVTIFLISMIGFPLTAGFSAKLLLFVSYFKFTPEFDVFLLFLPLMFGYVHSLKLINGVYYLDENHQKHKNFDNIKADSVLLKIIKTILVLFVVFGGLVPFNI
ncbi:MAG: hypothetical protein ISR65_09510 [Bacteriovoracaceae bacterium]|nr:hypothetical protein [Bacteriovoracaceae bacterium]